MDQNENLRRARLIKTCLLPIAFLSMGLNSGIKGPTLLDFTELLQCSVAAISSALMFYPIGILIGSVSGAFLTDKLTHLADALLAVNCTVMAICYAATPWCPSLWILRAVNLVGGFCQGNLNVACSSLTMRAWGKIAATPIHALHAFHSVGMFISAPLAGPFLSTNTTNHNNDSSTVEESIWHHNGTNTRIEIPFGVIGCVTFIAALNFAVFHCLGWTFSRLEILGKSVEQQDSSNQSHSSDQEVQTTEATHEEQENKTFKIIFLIFLFIIYIGIMYRDFVNFLFLFAIGHTSQLHMSKSLATIMTTSFFGSFALGRLSSIIYTRYVKIHIILFAELFSCVLFCSLMALLALKSVLNLWLLSCLLAFFSAPTYPTILAWSNHYLVTSGIVMAVIDLGIGAGSFSATWIGGLLLDNYGASAIFYLSLSVAFGMVILTLPIQVYAHLNKKHREDIRDMSPSAEPDDSSPLIN